MRIERLWLQNFRNFVELDLPLQAGGLTVVVGDNGQGKTNLLEAVGYLARLESFRGAPREALVRAGESAAVVRAAGCREGRSVLVETEIVPKGRDRAQVNRQPLRRARDLLGNLRVTVFSPDDLGLVKFGPSERRRYLDEVLVSLFPQHAARRADLERILRQRSTLLKHAGGRLTASDEATLSVWDDKLAEVGEALTSAREQLVQRLDPLVRELYGAMSGVVGEAEMVYERSWSGPLAGALGDHRSEDLRRCTTSVGPHRDDLVILLGSRSARSHGSQGEQRSLALALRLASHVVVEEEIGSPPVLLLDDVFSELDGRRAEALVERLPDAQAILTTAGSVPAGVAPAAVVRVDKGELELLAASCSKVR
jgi:DNA replication and repair protein RecF